MVELQPASTFASELHARAASARGPASQLNYSYLELDYLELTTKEADIIPPNGSCNKDPAY